MKDEIKEIFPKEFYINKKEEMVAEVSLENLNKIVDYITNLQEENKRLEEIIENLTTMTVCGDKKQIKNTAQYKLDIYKSRCEKAIKCIKDKYYKEEYERKGTFANKLMNILQGEDK